MCNSDDIIIRPGKLDSGIGNSFTDRTYIGAGGGRGSYGPGGLSNARRRRLRLAARAQRQAEEQARVQHEQAIATQAQAVQQQQLMAAAHQQMIAAQTQQFHAAKAVIDDYYGVRAAGLEQQLQAEMRAAKRAPDSSGSSDSWQVYQLKKEIAEINGIIAQKNPNYRPTIHKQVRFMAEIR